MTKAAKEMEEARVKVREYLRAKKDLETRNRKLIRVCRILVYTGRMALVVAAVDFMTAGFQFNNGRPKLGLIDIAAGIFVTYFGYYHKPQVRAMAKTELKAYKLSKKQKQGL